MEKTNRLLLGVFDMNKVNEVSELTKPYHVYQIFWSDDKKAENKQRIQRIIRGSLPNKIEYLDSFFVIDCEVNMKAASFKEYLDRQSDAFILAPVHKYKTITTLLGIDQATQQNEIHHDLLGADGWDTMTVFFQAISKLSSYVILRNYEFLPNDFFDNDKDIDLLCFDVEEFAAVANAVKRSDGISGYQCRIENRWVPVDIRFVGDDYYDISWEKRMLEDSVIYNDCVKIMDKENYLYSLIYHFLTQKDTIKTEYMIKCNELIEALGINEDRRDLEVADFIQLLTDYMNEKKYFYVHPKDMSVYQNEGNIKRLPRQIITKKEKYGIIYELYKHVPGFIQVLIPKRFK